MKISTKFVALLAAGVILAGCSGTDYTGTERGLNWDIETNLGANVRGRSTTYQFQTEKPLGTLTVSPDGSMDMTGPAVEIWARMAFCEEAPNASECNGF